MFADPLKRESLDPAPEQPDAGAQLPERPGEIALTHGFFTVSFAQAIVENAPDAVDNLTIALADQRGGRIGEIRFGRINEAQCAALLEVVLSSEDGSGGIPAMMALDEILSFSRKNAIPIHTSLGESRSAIVGRFEELRTAVEPLAPARTQSSIVRIMDIPQSGPATIRESNELGPPPPGTARWVDIENQDAETLEKLLRAYKFDRHAIRDCMTSDDRPRLDDYGSHLFIVTHALELDGQDSMHPRAHELHIFLRPGLIVTVHSAPIAEIDKTWSRTGEADMSRDERRAEHLLYRIMDRLLDRNEAAIDKLQRGVEKIYNEMQRKELDAELTKKTLPDISQTLCDLRRVVSPLGPMFTKLSKREDTLIDKKVAVLLGNLPEHATHLTQDIDDARHQIERVMESSLVTTANSFARTAVRIAIAQAIVLPAMAISSFFGQNFTGISFDSPYLMWGSIAASVTAAVATAYYFRRRL